jgi:hypothetical protein
VLFNLCLCGAALLPNAPSLTVTTAACRPTRAATAWQPFLCLLSTHSLPSHVRPQELKALFTRLRQSCVHPQLAGDSKQLYGGKRLSLEGCMEKLVVQAQRWLPFMMMINFTVRWAPMMSSLDLCWRTLTMRPALKTLACSS